jgi:hypothetical protein
MAAMLGSSADTAMSVISTGAGDVGIKSASAWGVESIWTTVGEVLATWLSRS